MESRAMKREYMKPTMKVVELQHQHQLLAESITDLQTTPLPATASGAAKHKEW